MVALASVAGTVSTTRSGKTPSLPSWVPGPVGVSAQPSDLSASAKRGVRRGASTRRATEAGSSSYATTRYCSA